MVHEQEDEEEPVRVPKRILLGIIVTAVAGSVPLNIYVQKSSTEVRSDPFTGSEGRVMGDRIMVLEQQIKAVPSEQLRINTTNIALLMNWTERMQRQIDAVELDCHEMARARK